MARYQHNDLTGGQVILGCALIVLFLALIPFVFMVAWNFVIPAVFGLAAINYLQAVALWIVFGFIFGGVRAVAS